MTTVAEILARALSMPGRGTLYWAGAGGLDPRAASPAVPLAVGREWPRLPAQQQAAFRPLAEAAGLDVDDPGLVVPACDCSGFVCWALGISRRIPAGGAGGGDEWLNTDSIWNDARGSGTRFRRIDVAVPGCLVVYPKPRDEPFGHIGVVIEAGPDGRATRVAHCSATHFKAPPFDAIQVDAGEPFWKQPTSIYAWFEGAVA